jgi:glycogen(starch) synthase
MSTKARKIAICTRPLRSVAFAGRFQRKHRMMLRIFFAAGPGNVIGAHRHWRDGVPDPGQMSITFSSEFEALCAEILASAYIVSSAGPAALITDGEFILEHRPKRKASGVFYHLNEIKYCLGLARTARKFGADYAILQSGTTHYFAMSLFRLFGIKGIPVLHNTLWPSGFPPSSRVARVVLFLDSLFFRWGATAVLGVSPECLRQVDQATNGLHGPMYQFMPQFDPSLFVPSEPPPFSDRFKLLFAGRISADKGVFDLLQIMKIVEERWGDRVILDVCGDGPDLTDLRSRCKGEGLDHIVNILGFTAPEQLRKLLTASHASIVPTRSGFAEGMAMTVIEPILLGRPVITNAVVPALEVLRPACIEAETDSVESYVNAVMKLASSPELYAQLRNACVSLRPQFFDRSKSSQSALHKALSFANAC